MLQLAQIKIAFIINIVTVSGGLYQNNTQNPDMNTRRIMTADDGRQFVRVKGYPLLVERLTMLSEGKMDILNMQDST